MLPQSTVGELILAKAVARDLNESGIVEAKFGRKLMLIKSLT